MLGTEGVGNVYMYVSKEGRKEGFQKMGRGGGRWGSGNWEGRKSE